MTPWKIGFRAVFVVFVLLLPLPGCQAQQARRQSGLLLGLTDITEKPKYQTFWLYPSASQLSIRLLQGLVVPRQDGFWRVDSSDSCSLDQNTEDGIEKPIGGDNNDERRIDISIEQEEHLWFVPIGSSPHIKGTSCEKVNDDAARISQLAEAKIKAAGKKVAEDSREGDVCVSSGSVVEFINGKYMSASSGYSTECGVHPDSYPGWSVEPFGGGQAIKIEEVFGSSAAVQFEKAVQDNIQNACDENCKPETIDTSKWIIHHDQRRWQVKGYASTHRLCGFFEEFDLNLNVPPNVVGEQFNKVDWGRLSRGVPNVIDAVISPDQRWGVLLVGPSCKPSQKNCDLARSIQIYRFENGRPAKQLYSTRITQGGQIVMAEWALGKNADRWDQTMKSLPVSSPAAQFDQPESHK
jgi:hypothetical protein